MDGRRQFLQSLATQNPSRLDQAIALLWYYEQTQLYTERSASDLAADIRDEGFGQQNVTRLANSLRRSAFTVAGTVRGTFRINAARFQGLSERFSDLLNISEPPEVTSSVIPIDFVTGTRTYLERMVKQINGSYDVGFYDGSAVMLRRLAESLLIEIYISQSRQSEIKRGGVFFQLSELITHITNDASITKSRSFVRGLALIKDIGDTAAHDRTYITPQQDISDNLTSIRRTIHELLVLAGIQN